MSAPLPKLDGHFDGIIDNHACGWIYSADAPRTRLEVELVSDDEQVVARGIANCFRQSLLEAGIGDGKHAFSIAVPASVSDGEAHRLSVREAYSGQVLAGGDKRFQSGTTTESASTKAMAQTATGPAASPTQHQGSSRSEPFHSRDAAAPAQQGSKPHSVRVQGVFDKVSDDRALGWVFSPDAPGTRLEVEILCGDQVVGRGVANFERDDLIGSGYGDGRHGFDVPIDRSRCHEISAQLSAREAYSGQMLAGSPQRLDAGPAQQSSSLSDHSRSSDAIRTSEFAGEGGSSADHTTSNEATAAAGDEPIKVHGHFDDLLNGNADGWVFFPERPQLRADVEVLCDGRVVATGKADRLRPDLQEAGITDGRCSFSLPVDPSLFDGGPHQLSVREQRTGQVLEGSPKTLHQQPGGASRGAFASQPEAANVNAPLGVSSSAAADAEPMRPPEPAPGGSHPQQQAAVEATASHAAETAMMPALEGRLEALRNGHVEGWALDPVDPLRRLQVEVLCDGHLQGRCAADLYRSDLAEAGVGDGRHAFSLPLSASLFDGDQHSLVAREHDSGVLLEGSPLTCRLQALAPAEPAHPEASAQFAADAKRDSGSGGQPERQSGIGAAPEAADWSNEHRSNPEPRGQTDARATVAPALEPVTPPSESELQGRFEGIVNGQVCGWAIDPLRPELRVELEILCDGEPLARTRADLEREDLAEVALGDGRHGFRSTLGAGLFDGQPHELSVRVLRTQQLLPGSPQRLQSEAPPARVRPADVQGAFEAISGTRAIGYAWDLSRPEHRLEVEILCESEVIGRAPAKTFRRDLYESGIGDGRHAFSAPISYELFDAKPHWLTAREAHTGKSLTHGPHLFEQASANWPFDLMPRSETLKQFDTLIAEPGVASRAFDAERCRSLLLDASLRQEMRQTEAARAIYRQLLTQLGENSLCHCKLAETWLLDGEPDPALDAYRRAASLPSPSFWAYLGAGQCGSSQRSRAGRPPWLDPGSGDQFRRSGGVRASGYLW